jgi:Periplasmic copper-binding protein (NosD)
MQRVYLRGLITAAMVATTIVALPVVASAASSSTIYVDNDNKSCTDTGSGTDAAPFCTIQAAADAAVAGDTVQVVEGLYGPVSITNSGTAAEPITFLGSTLGLGDEVTVGYSGSNAEGPPAANGIDIDGASNIVVRGFGAVGSSSLILVDNSTNVTLDQNVLGAGSTDVGIEVAGTSSDVTVSRNFVGYSASTATGIQVDSGVRDTTITTNEFETDDSPGIVVNGAAGTVVNSNTVTTQCGAGITLSGASTGSTLENNIVDTAENTTPETACSAPEPNSIEVDAAAVSGTVADYNLIDPNSGGPLYDWSGTPYSSLSAFNSATSQGSHDIAADPDLSGQFNQNGLDLTGDSPAIDSADANAPGELSTDVLDNPRADDPQVANIGTGAGYYDRGAFEFEAPLNQLTVSSAKQTGGGPLDVTFTVSINNPWADSATYTIYFGDGATQVVTTTSETFAVNHSFTANINTLDDAQVFVTDASSRPDIDAQAIASVGAGYTPVTPLRILDTRNAIGISTKTPISGGSDVVVQVAGKGGVPANAQAVVVNVTAVSPTAGGLLTVYPDGSTQPGTSSLNYAANQTVPNLVTTEMTDGKIRIHVNESGTTHILVDLQGYYGDSGEPYAATGPTRVLDTRKAIGIPTKTPLPADGTISLNLAGQLPAGTTAVAMNLTETGATGSGVLTVYPKGSTLPVASNLNYTTGQTLANEVIVPVVDDTVEIHESGHGSANVLADLAGYYGSAAKDYFTPSPPSRFVDTRSDKGAGPIQAATSEEISASYIYLAAVVVYNLTETQSTAGGYLTLYEGGTGVPAVSNINFAANTTRANMAMVPVSYNTQADALSVYDGQSTGHVDYILDLDGIFNPITYASGTEL